MDEANAVLPMRIAVTGGSGRIGSHVVKLLIERGHTVINIDKRQAKEPRGRFVYCDLRDRAQVQRILEEVDAVAHLGEIPNVTYHHAPEEVYAHNTAAGSVILQTAADLRIKRVVYTSSCQVYGMWGEPIKPPVSLPFDETHPLQPQNVYALAKAANEGFARLCSEQHGLSVAIFRFPAVRPWTVEQFSENDWNWMRNGGFMNDGMQTYVHISDAAMAFALALENPRPGCEAYHFSAREISSYASLSERVKQYKSFPALPPDWPSHASPVVCKKAQDHFGWSATWNLLDHFRQKFGPIPISA